MSAAPTRILPPRHEPTSRRRAPWLALLVLAASACWPQPVPPPAPPDTDGPEQLSALEVAPLPDIVPSEPRYAATHVLIAWQGAARAAPSVTRSEADAIQLARDLHGRALAGEDLGQMAERYSDGPSGPRGGSLGVYATGTMVPDFERAVASVAVGEIAPLVRSPFGLHIARRDAVVEARLWHAQIAFDGAWRSTATRTKDEARQRAREVLDALSAGTPPDQVARSYSDDPSAQTNGGDLGLVAPGQLVPAFEAAAFALEPGATSEIVETPYGFHIIRREP